MSLPAASFPCCRAHELFGPIDKHPAALQRNAGDEAYWFNWDGIDGDATIRIARLGVEAMFFRVYRGSRFGKVRRHRGTVSLSEWARFEDALIAANFWMLDEFGGDHILDGENWCVAGCRQRDYHLISRCSPEGALWDLGRIFFDLAGLEDVRLG
jgi:hypothetical protein